MLVLLDAVGYLLLSGFWQDFIDLLSTMPPS